MHTVSRKIGDVPAGKFDELQTKLSALQQLPEMKALQGERQAAIDNIKEYLYNDIAGDDLNAILDADVTEFYNKHLIYEEDSKFYDTEIKTGLLKRLNRALSNEVFDSYTVLKKPNLTINGIETDVDINFLKECDQVGRQFGEFALKFDPDGTVTIYEPWLYSNVDGRITYIDSFESNSFVHYRTRQKIGDQMRENLFMKDTKTGKVNDVKTYKYDNGGEVMFEIIEYEDHFEDALYELVMFHSEIYTSMQKEIYTTSPELFVDEGYLVDGKMDKKRVAYTPVKNQESVPGDGTKPLFEVYAPDIRTQAYQDAIDMLESKISIIAGYNISEATGNATEGIIAHDTIAKRINSYKTQADYHINKLISMYFDAGQKLKLMSYRLQSQESIIKNGVLLVNNNISSNLLVLRDLYPNMSEKELEITYLTVEIKSGRPLTLEEKNRAIELGLYEEPAPMVDPNAQVDANGKPVDQASKDTSTKPAGNSTDKNMTTDQTTEKQTQVNTQGVSAGEGVK